MKNTPSFNISAQKPVFARTPDDEYLDYVEAYIAKGGLFGLRDIITNSERHGLCVIPGATRFLHRADLLAPDIMIVLKGEDLETLTIDPHTRALPTIPHKDHPPILTKKLLIMLKKRQKHSPYDIFQISKRPMPQINWMSTVKPDTIWNMVKTFRFLDGQKEKKSFKISDDDIHWTTQQIFATCNIDEVKAILERTKYTSYRDIHGLSVYDHLESMKKIKTTKTEFETIRDRFSETLKREIRLYDALKEKILTPQTQKHRPSRRDYIGNSYTVFYF